MRGDKSDYELYDSGDSICVCGAFQSVHEPRDEGGILVEGHGGYAATGCERFVWAKAAAPRWRKREAAGERGR